MDADWFLETVAADGSRLMHEIGSLPYRVGRDPANDLVEATMGLSRRHAELGADISGRLRLTDLDSTNGSFVNRQRVHGSVLLADDDVIHFAQAEFRIRRRDDGLTILQRAPAGDGERTLLVAPGRALSENFVPHEREFKELLRGQGLSGALQPIVDMRTRTLQAYEWLGRGRHPELPQSPIHLFHMAARLGRESELSQAFRELGIRIVAARGEGTTLFVNTHPKETFDEGFLQTLARVQEQPGAPRLVVEVHETAVMEVARMKELAARLEGIGVRFAYDDFGAGQARLNELGEVPAHFVKFDMGLIRGIDLASERKQKVVADLVRLVTELGSVPLAEGVETEAEAEICRQMGFQLVQGYLTGKPVPVDASGAAPAPPPSPVPPPKA
ncbi:MAG: diguanylate phosphodiesterase [Rubrivivax sp. SCN 71-131]|nr:MAG: diguanylate phosphodiesterase [Rubrivivax sp. SCN 71-131]